MSRNNPGPACSEISCICKFAGLEIESGMLSVLHYLGIRSFTLRIRRVIIQNLIHISSKKNLICTLEVIITLSLIIVPFSIVSLPMHLG